mgnify:CR=1 FL=1
MRCCISVVALALVACAQGAPKAEEPYWGKQPCAHCSMLVSEPRPSAQALLENGQRRYFDDLGCLVAWEARESPKLKARWVRTPRDDGWVAPEATHFSAGNATPMDFGFLSADEGLGFDEVRAAVLARTRRPR